LIVLSAIALYINVGSYGVVESSDARYAEIAREMVVTGDYLHPNLLNVHHYHKPPFTYYVTALGYKIFGINSFGARFFLQLAVLIQIILVYLLSLAIFNNRKTALWSAVIYISFPIVLISSRNLTTDAFLATFALLSMLSWVKYRKTGEWKYLYLFTTSFALGFLTKGPVIFIVPVPFIIAYNRTENAKNGFSFHHIIAWLLFIVLASSWYLLLVNENPDFLGYFLGHQTVDRFAKNAFDRSEPFWYFIVLAPAVGIPWLFLLPFLAKVNKKLFTNRSVYTALLLGILTPLVFFSISSSKRILYILPFYSLIAVLTAQLISFVNISISKKITKIIFIYSIVIFSAFAATQLFDLDINIPSLTVVGAVFMILITVIIYNSRELDMQSKTVFSTFVVSAFLVIAASHIMSANELKINSPKPVTDFIIKQGLNNRNIIIYNTRKPSIAFGLNKPVISLYDGSKDLDRETQFEQDTQWKQYLIDMSKDNEVLKLKSLLDEPTVLIVYKHPLPENRLWLTDGYENVKQMGKWTIYY
ncbi:MAG: glycosyltransferase family 39 protein, partial [Chlorobi bacterium]|nr:glycosyltransferase family 39 protein [Chlorobiota bacterium]